MALEKELETYRRELTRLASDEGKWVLIKGDEVIEIFETYEDALKIGYQRFGLEPFMVKQIQTIEQVYSFTRDLMRTCQ